MFSIKRNQIIVTALAVMVAVAGYLNFTEDRGSELGDTALNITEEGDTYAVLGDSYDIEPIADIAPEDMDMAGGALDELTAEASGGVKTADSGGDDDGAAVFVSAGGGTDAYFVQAKLDREQSRSKQKDMLNDMMKNENLGDGQKTSAADAMLDLQKRIEKETAAEAMIEAKGFKEAYVRIDDETVDVVVDKAELTPEELAQIEDIVTRKTGFPVEKIRISPLKKSS